MKEFTNGLSGKKTIEEKEVKDMSYIIRNNEKIELTPEEIRRIHDECEFAFRMEDAIIALFSFVFGSESDEAYSDYVFDGKVRPELRSLETEFNQKYNVVFSELINQNSENYALKKLARIFIDKHDCNTDENSLWEIIITNYLEGK